MHKAILFALMFAVATACIATEAQVLLDEIIDTYSRTPALEARFIQQNHWPDLDRTMTSQGVMYYDQQRLLLRYDEPEGHVLLSLPESTHMWDPSANREIIMDPDEIASHLRPAEIVSYYAEGAQLRLEQAGDNRLLIIEPDEALGLTKLEVTWNPRTKRIITIKYATIDGDLVTYEFTEQNFLHDIDPDTFVLKLPGDRDIIDTRK